MACLLVLVIAATVLTVQHEAIARSEHDSDAAGGVSYFFCLFVLNNESCLLILRVHREN
jgi:hypothetical protein